MYKAIIFDLDGTLVDTIADIASCLNGTLAQHGFPTKTEAELYTLVGNGLRVLVSRCLPEALRTDALVDECTAQVNARYAAAPAAASRPYPGVLELLGELASRGVPCAILSNKPDPLARPLVEAVLPAGVFRIVRGELPGAPRKPDPRSALAIAAELGSMPEETVFLGDSDVDILTARAGGFFPVGAAWGFRGREELRSAGAAAIIDHPLELLALL